MKDATSSKAYSKMTAVELSELTKRFDREFVIDDARPLNAAERAKWSRLKRKPGRPKVGEGVEVVSVSIERGLLKKSDRLAKKLKVSRAKLIATGLERVLAEAAKRTGGTGKPRKRAA